MKQFYVYLHLKPNGDPFYVGKGCGKRSHLFVDRNVHHRAVTNKYGIENIEVLVFMRESEQHAFESEKLFIQVLREAGCKLTNVCDGGEGASGRKLSAESLQKMSENHKGQPAWNKGVPATEDARRKMSEAQMGKKQSDATIAKRFESRKGYAHSEETKAKIRAAHIGKIMSDSARKNMSIAKKGHVQSPEQRRKRSESLKGRPWSEARRAANG